MNPEWNSTVPGGDPKNLPSWYDLDSALGDLRKKLWDAKEALCIKESVKRQETRTRTAIEGEPGTLDSQIQSLPSQDPARFQVKEYNQAWYPEEYLAFVAYGPPCTNVEHPMLERTQKNRCFNADIFEKRCFRERESRGAASESCGGVS